MFMSRGNCGICVLALALALAMVGAGWAQTVKPISPDHAILYRRAVGFLDQAEQKLARGLSRRLGMVTAMRTIKKWNYAREAKFVDD